MSAAEERSGADDEESEECEKETFARPSRDAWASSGSDQPRDAWASSDSDQPRDAWASSGSDQAWKGYGIKETIEEVCRRNEQI